jgi:hypothetical protein
LSEKLIDLQQELLQSGIVPGLDEEQILLWEENRNVVHEDQGLARYFGADQIDTVTESITNITQLQSSSGVKQAVISGNTSIWLYDGAVVTLINSPFTAGGKPVLETWGNWVLATNGVDPVKIWKGSGVFGNLAGTTFTRALQVIRRQPYMFALNTNVGFSNVHWCSDDNVEVWTPLPTNTAGDFNIRDLAGEIKGGCPIGENLGIYSQEAISIAAYVGPPAIFGFNTTVRGVGIYGPKAVAAFGGQNFGFGPQGLFITDGFSFNMLSSDVMRNYIKKNLDESKAHDITVLYNELAETAEFRFPMLDGTYRGYIFKLATKRFTETDLQVNAVIEREVFKDPLIAVGNAFCKLTRDVNTWNEQDFDGWVRTKWLDGGVPEFSKLWDYVRLNGIWTDMTVEIALMGDKNEIRTILQPTDAETIHNLIEDGAKIKFTFSGKEYWRLSRIRAFGEISSVIR